MSQNNTDKMVDHPPHYNQGKVECIEAIIAATGDGAQHYLQGNIIKYVWRYKHRHGTQDLKKAQWYLNALIELVDKQSPIDNTEELEKKIRGEDERFDQASRDAWQLWNDAEIETLHPESYVQYLRETYKQIVKTWYQFRIEHFNIFYPNGKEGWEENTVIDAQEEILYNEMNKARDNWVSKDDESLAKIYRQSRDTWCEFRLKHGLQPQQKPETLTSPTPSDIHSGKCSYHP